MKNWKIFICLFLMMLIFTSICFAGKSGGVTDTNNNKKGDILIGTGKNTGGRSVGTWVDSDFLKGEQGERGKRGKRGFQGDTPEHKWQDTKLRFEDGSNVWGEWVDLKGDIGEVDKKTVNRLDGRINNNTQRIDGHDNRIGDLEETEYNLAGELILLQGKRHKLGVYGKYDVRHNRVPEVGLKITFALGDSWETKEIEKLSKKLDNITNKLNRYNIETEKIKTEDGYRLQIKDKNKSMKFVNLL